MGRFAEHQFAIVELQGVGVAGVGDAVDFRAPGEFVEDRVHVRITQRAHVGDLDAEPGQRVGHDWAVAAQLRALIDELDIGAVPGGGGDPLAESRNGRHPLVRLGVVPFVHDVDNLIDKTIQADKRPQPARRFDHGQQSGRNLLAKLGRFPHKKVRVLACPFRAMAGTGNEASGVSSP